MAGSPWMCAQCGAVNDPAAGRCGRCANLAPGRVRARALWVLLTLMLVAGVAVGGVLLFTGRPRPAPAAGPFPAYTTPAVSTTTTVVTTANAFTPPVTSTPSTSATPGEKPCPGDAARYLPGGEGTALLVAQTEKSLVTICRVPDGRIFYDGQARGQPASDETHIVLPAQASGDGFVAKNGDYTYQVGDGKLVVSVGSEVLSDEDLTTIG